MCEEKIKIELKGEVLSDARDGDSNIKAELKEGELSDAKNGDSLLISRAMAEEEEKLLEARIKEEAFEEKKAEDSVHLNETKFTKLDELLTQTQLYSEFLLEKMDDITFVLLHKPFLVIFCSWESSLLCYFILFLICKLYFQNGAEQSGDTSVKKKGRGVKRKASASYNNVRNSSFDYRFFV